MKLLFERQFLKDLKSIKTESTKSSIEQVLINLKETSEFSKIRNIKKLKGHKTAYRVRVGDYRLCFYHEQKSLIITRVLHRQKVYKYFP